MLIQAVSSIARERLLGSTSRRGGGGGGGGDGRGRGRSSGDMQDTLLKDGVRDSPSLTEASAPGRGVEALTGWLEGRRSEVSGACLCRRRLRLVVSPAGSSIIARSVMVLLSLLSHPGMDPEGGGGGCDQFRRVFILVGGVFLHSGGGDRGLRGRWYLVVAMSVHIRKYVRLSGSPPHPPP